MMKLKTKMEIADYINRMYEYDDFDLLMHKICFHGAATINRVKPSFLICLKNSSSFKLKDIWEKYKYEVKETVPFDYKELKTCRDGVNVLFYRRDWLSRIINSNKVYQYLQGNGYQGVKSVDHALEILSNRYSNGCPDEIGVFLGYPLADVIAFSSTDKHCSICTGYWRVYSNADRAKKIFGVYDKARSNIVDSLEKGIKPQKIIELAS